MDTLLIARRHRGPARSGNGGWTAGALAERLLERTGPATVEVTLRRPPPLETALRVDVADPKASLLDDAGELIAVAVPVDRSLDPVEPVSHEIATAASAAYPGLVSHPFPSCFVCGTDRPDGLRIFPGPVAGTAAGPDPLVAAPWTPPEDVDVATTWAALDCIGGWAGDLTDRLMVLGRITARVDTLPVAGEPHVVTGRALGHEGRRTMTAATLYDQDGRIVAEATHVWVTVDPAAFN